MQEKHSEDLEDQLELKSLIPVKQPMKLIRRLPSNVYMEYLKVQPGQPISCSSGYTASVPQMDEITSDLNRSRELVDASLQSRTSEVMRLNFLKSSKKGKQSNQREANRDKS